MRSDFGAGSLTLAAPGPRRLSDKGRLKSTNKVPIDVERDHNGKRQNRNRLSGILQPEEAGQCCNALALHHWRPMIGEIGSPMVSDDLTKNKLASAIVGNTISARIDLFLRRLHVFGDSVTTLAIGVRKTWSYQVDH